MSFIFPPYLIYLIGAIFVPFLTEKTRKWFTLAFAALGLVAVLSLHIGTSLTAHYLGFTINYLKVDKLSIFVAYAFSIIGFFAVIYSLKGNKNLHTAALLYMGAGLGVVFAGDYLTLYVFWELLAVFGTYMIFLKGTDEARKASLRYLYFHIIGGVLLIGGIMFNFSATGSFMIAKSAPGLATVFILLGVGVNCAFVLLHTWLPDSYPKADFMASIFLSVYTTKSAVYLLARTSSGLTFVAYMGAAMAVFGVTMALMQSNARKLLSYHIISQVGYMVCGIGIGSAMAYNGAVFHLFNNIFYKSLLFMTIGAVIYKLGEEDLTKLGGLARKMPITSFFVIIASLSIAGFPLFNGFASKHLILVSSEGLGVINILLELAAVGTLLSFLKFSYFGFFKGTDWSKRGISEASPSMLIGMTGSAVVCVGVGIFPGLLEKLLPFELEVNTFAISGVVGTILLFAVTIILFFVANSYFEPHRRYIRDVDTLYIKGIGYLAVIPAICSRANDTYDNFLLNFAKFFKGIKKPSTNVGDFINNTVFAFFVDMWTVDKSKPVRVSAKEPKYSLQTVISIPVSLAGEKLSSLSAWFDSNVVDRTVNCVGAFTDFIGKQVRRLQSGSVQIYVIAFALAIIILILLTKGGR